MPSSRHGLFIGSVGCRPSPKMPVLKFPLSRASLAFTRVAGARDQMQQIRNGFLTFSNAWRALLIGVRFFIRPSPSLTLTALNTSSTVSVMVRLPIISKNLSQPAFLLRDVFVLTDFPVSTAHSRGSKKTPSVTVAGHFLVCD